MAILKKRYQPPVRWASGTTVADFGVTPEEQQDIDEEARLVQNVYQTSLLPVRTTSQASYRSAVPFGG